MADIWRWEKHGTLKEFERGREDVEELACVIMEADKSKRVGLA